MNHSTLLRMARRPRAFSLVELLVVMGIMGILAAIAVPLISSVMRAQTMNQSISKLSGILEMARSEAMDKNSYVWVAFTTPSTSNPGNGIWVATITSADGTEALVNNGTWVTTTTIPSSTLQLVSRLQNLPGVQISSTSNLSDLVTASGNSTLLNTLQTNLSWTVTPVQNAEGFSSSTMFTQAIEFTPSGESRGYGPASWYNHIQFGLQPTLGSSTNSALYNVGRSSGKVSVYRR